MSKKRKSGKSARSGKRSAAAGPGFWLKVEAINKALERFQRRLENPPAKPKDPEALERIVDTIEALKITLSCQKQMSREF